MALKREESELFSNLTDRSLYEWPSSCWPPQHPPLFLSPPSQIHRLYLTATSHSRCSCLPLSRIRFLNASFLAFKGSLSFSTLRAQGSFRDTGFWKQPGLEVLPCYVIIASIAQCCYCLFLYTSTTKLRILKNLRIYWIGQHLMENPRQTLWPAQYFVLCWVLRSWPMADLPWMAVASTAGTSPSFLEVRPFFCTCSLTQETDSQESLTCFDFLPSVQPKECPGKDRKRGEGVW